MLPRRDFLHLSMASAALIGASGLGNGSRLAAQDRFDQAALLAFEDFGNVTLCHFSDLHGQLQPHYLRMPSQRTPPVAGAVDDAYLTGEAYRIRYGVGGGTPMDYALTHENFVALARAYGPMGGLDRVARVIEAIRTVRPGALLLAGGNCWTGSMISDLTIGQAVVDAVVALLPDAMTFQGELSLGAERLKEIIAAQPVAPLAQNIFEGGTDQIAAPFEPYRVFERGGAKIAVIGQATPHGAHGQPPGWRSSHQIDHMQRMVEEVREAGAGLVVCLSQNGIDADARMAREVRGIDVILSGNGSVALPEPVEVGQSVIVASGSHGRFVSRIDLDVQEGELRGLRHRLIPIFTEIMDADLEMSELIAARRAGFAEDLDKMIGQAEGLLARGGSFQSTWENLICAALRKGTGAQIALVPALPVGPAVLPGHRITQEDLHAVIAGGPAQVTIRKMTGSALKMLLEQAGDTFANPDPFQRDGLGMMRAGGLGFTFDMGAAKGDRISAMTLLEGGARIDLEESYAVAGWGIAAAQDEDPQIAALLARHIARHGTDDRAGRTAVTLAPLTRGQAPRISRRPPTAP